MSEAPVPPEAVRAADPKRPPFAEWPQQALIAALEALDFRVMHAGLDISAHQAVLLASDILHGVTPAIRAAERARIRQMAERGKTALAQPNGYPIAAVPWAHLAGILSDAMKGCSPACPCPDECAEDGCMAPDGDPDG